MISTKMIKDKGNLAVVECICKIGRTERCLRNCDTEGNITTSQDAYDNTTFKRRFDLKAILGTHEFAYRNLMLMEPDELMTKVAQTNKLLYKPNQERNCLTVDGMTALQVVGGSQEIHQISIHGSKCHRHENC